MNYFMLFSHNKQAFLISFALMVIGVAVMLYNKDYDKISI